MAQTEILSRGRSGWKPEEQSILWQEVRRAAEDGQALRTVFDTVAQKTGRKPNSIRNYYYVCVKGGGAPSGMQCQRALPFTPFDENELHWLVRQILLARTRGISVRACVMDLGEGDRAKTLRYQNKYRSILKTRPEYIRQVIQELEQEGVVFDETFTPVRKKKYALARCSPADATPAEQLYTALSQGGPECAKVIQALCQFLQEASSACTGGEHCSQS